MTTEANDEVNHKFKMLDTSKMWMLKEGKCVEKEMQNLAIECKSDLLKHIWSIIDTCFEGSNIEVLSGERVPIVTSKRIKNKRVIPVGEQLERRKTRSKVDLLLKSNSYELRIVEAGKINDTSSTKSIVELNHKVPNILKDMLVDLASESPSNLRTIKVFGLVISGLQILPIMVDCPGGYVCRFSKFSSWLHFPKSPTELIPKMKLLCTVLSHVKTQMNDVFKSIEANSDSLVLTFSTTERALLLPCITVIPASKAKRKAEEINV